MATDEQSLAQQDAANRAPLVGLDPAQQVEHLALALLTEQSSNAGNRQRIRHLQEQVAQLQRIDTSAG